MESNPATLAGAVRSAMQCIGQAAQRSRWADLAPRSGWRLVVQPKAINLIVSKGAEQLYGFLEPMLFYRPVFRDHRTSLCSTCGQPDQGVKHASPANVKNRSKGSIASSFGIVLHRGIGPRTGIAPFSVTFAPHGLPVRVGRYGVDCNRTPCVQ